MSTSSVLQNRDYIQTHCNEYRKTFHFACHQWNSNNNPHFEKVYLHEFKYTY